MKFNGTIIITDPCYIIKKSTLKHPQAKDFNLPDSINSKRFDEYSTFDELAYKKACDEYYLKKKEEPDDWYNCDFGANMSVLGLKTYICDNTIYGDWSCTTFKTDEDPKELIESICDDYTNPLVSMKPIKLTSIGEFCADSGQVAVFLLDEVLVYNPDFEEWAKQHDWCVTTIKDFKGNVEYYIDSIGDAHIIGKGNINFMTTQFGL